MKIIQLSLLFSIFFTCSLFAQTATIHGIVMDSDSEETLPFANVAILQNGSIITGTTTDFDGMYSINLDIGVYDLEVSYVGLQTFRVANISLRKDLELNMNLGETPYITGSVVKEDKSNNIAYIGSLQGVVKKEGSFIAGAEVYIWEDKKAVKKVTTDPGGNYILSNLIPGFYDVFVSYPDGSESEWHHVYVPQRRIKQLNFLN